MELEGPGIELEGFTNNLACNPPAGSGLRRPCRESVQDLGRYPVALMHLDGGLQQYARRVGGLRASTRGRNRKPGAKPGSDLVGDAGFEPATLAV